MKNGKQDPKSAGQFDAKRIRLSDPSKNLSKFGVKAIGIIGFEPVQGPYLTTYLLEGNISKFFTKLLRDPAFVTELSVLGKWIKYFITLNGTPGFIYFIDETRRDYLIAELEKEQKTTALSFLKRLAHKLENHSPEELKKQLEELLS